MRCASRGTTTSTSSSLSLWRDNVCAGSFRLTVEEVPALIDMLRRGLDAAYAVAASRSPRTEDTRPLYEPGVPHAG